MAGLSITTVEGLGTADALHFLQEAFIAEQAIQCGYCAAGMIVGAQGLLNQVRYPTDDDIRQALSDNLCRCGVYDRVRRAIKRRIGQPEPAPIYKVQTKLTGPEVDVSLDFPTSCDKRPNWTGGFAATQTAP